MSEAPRIQLLSPRLANQIAAGEVVERPASVAKELLENSLDAGSRRIDVEVEQGGIKLLRVRDDGRGIPADDLPLALARHATSKIRELEDLERVMSLGFRGEALASISSVARLTMTSRTADAGEAWQVETEGRDMQPRVQPAAHPVGTSVEVRDLFFNTPARRKFLRAEKTEFDHLQEVIKRLALARFDVAFHLRHNGKTIFALHEARDELARARRVGAVCGQAFLEQALPIEVERNGLHLWGWVGLPTFSRSQPDLQYFYVNGRMVRDKLVAHAVRQAYRDVLYNGRHPTFVLFFEVDPAVVDVNVHPTKHEVRFRDSRMVHDFLYGTLHRALGEVRPDDQLAPPGATSLTEPRPTGAAAGEFGPQGEMRLAESVLESPAARVGWSGGSSASGGSSGYSAYTRPEAPPSLAEAGGAYKAYFAPLPAGEAPAALPESAQDIPPLGYALAQLKGIYILAENAHGLVLVDMHAAHERITYERLKVAMASEGLRGQPLLVPESIAVSEREADCAEEHSSWFQRLGFELQRLGPESLAIRQIPALLKQAEATQLVRDVIADLLEYGTSDRIQAHLNELLGTMACHGAEQLVQVRLDTVTGELISVDSALIYRGMDIGTAKPSRELLARYPHRLIDIRDPAESYSAAEFRADALAAMAKATARGRIPLLVGGTMLYYKALLEGLADMPGADPEVRAAIEAEAQAEGWEALHRQLAEVDPESAARIHPNDPQRLMRALEVYRLGGVSMSDLRRRQSAEKADFDASGRNQLPYTVAQLAIAPEQRQVLHARIAQRFRQMLEQGFIAEVEALHARSDLHAGLPSIRAVGYRQVWDYLDGKLSYAEMTERGIIATRQLAKRQFTWLRSWSHLHWMDSLAGDNLPRALKYLKTVSILA